MKRHYFRILLLAVFFVVSGCAASAPRYMAFKEDPTFNIFKVKPEKGYAALVVARTTKFGGAIEFDTFLDKKMIGVTQWKSYFVKTNITPGVHYVITRAESVEPAKINFKPDRIYYLQQIPRMGVWRARVSVALVTPQELSTSFDSDCRLLAYDVQNPGEDMSDKDYREAINDYEREVKEGRHQEDSSYNGIPAK